MEDCSSDYKTLKIWDNYNCIQTLEGHTHSDYGSIIEMNNYIISSSYDKTLEIWDESAYQSNTIINDVECGYWHSLSK